MAIKDLDKRKEVVRNLKFCPDEMGDLKRYADKYNLKPATALRVVICSELENFMENNKKEITLHFPYDNEEEIDNQEKETVVVCKLPPMVYAEIARICRTTGINQQAFIKYLIRPKLQLLSGAGEGN